MPDCCDCTADQFLGVWKVRLGSREEEDVTITEAGGDYQISGDGLMETVTLDEEAFTLKNDRICVSLWQDCEQLFGAEGVAANLQVWAASERLQPGPGAPTKPIGPSPAWAGSRTVRRRYPSHRHADKAPALEGDTVVITATGGDRFDIGVEGSTGPYDTLVLNPGNRTLDTESPKSLGSRRCVAKWDRTDSACTFAMLVLDPETGAALSKTLEALPAWPPAAQWTPDTWRDLLTSPEVLAVLRQFHVLPIELAGLLEDDGGVVVWGADEG